jgi:enoyl-CoA hydratase
VKQVSDKIIIFWQVFPPDQLVGEAIKTADKIASHSKMIVQICKESTNAAYELSLREGMRFEKRMFQAGCAAPWDWREFYLDQSPNF